MQLNSKIRINRAQVPMLSIRSGTQLINEISKKAASDTDFSRRSSFGYYTDRQKKDTTQTLTYGINGTANRYSDLTKGALINAFA